METEVMWDNKAKSPTRAYNKFSTLILVNGNDGTSLTDGRLADLAPGLWL